MKKITLLCYEYYDIQQGMKNFLCTDGTRPILGYIHIIVKDQKVTFEACDGYMAIRIGSFKRHCKLYIPDNKTSPIYIKPFKDESCWDTEAIVLPARERK